MRVSVPVGLRPRPVHAPVRRPRLDHSPGGTPKVAQILSQRLCITKGQRARERRDGGRHVTEIGPVCKRLHPAARVALAVFCGNDPAMEEAVARVLSSPEESTRELARRTGVDRSTINRRAREFADRLAEAWRRSGMDPAELVTSV